MYWLWKWIRCCFLWETVFSKLTVFSEFFLIVWQHNILHMFHFNSNVIKGLFLKKIFKALPNFSRSSLPNPWILKVFSFKRLSSHPCLDSYSDSIRSSFFKGFACDGHSLTLHSSHTSWNPATLERFEIYVTFSLHFCIYYLGSQWETDGWRHWMDGKSCWC